MGYTGFCEAFTSTHCYVGSTNMRLWTQEYKSLWVIPVQWQYSSESIDLQFCPLRQLKWYLITLKAGGITYNFSLDTYLGFSLFF